MTAERCSRPKTPGQDHPQIREEDARFGAAWSKGDYCHFSNWLQAIRSRNRSELSAEILEGHLSSALCHTGMISHRIGQTMPPGKVLERIQGNRLAAERFGSFREHLERNGVDLSESRATVGPWLTMERPRSVLSTARRPNRFCAARIANHL